MKYRTLGDTGIKVSELCFGALPMGPLQKNLPVDLCAEIMLKALMGGVNFIDTAQAYQTYEHIARVLKKVDKRPVIATKSAVSTYEEMEEAIKEALEMLGVDYIDIFHLHAARVDNDVFIKREGAYACLKDYRSKGIIKAVGISSHSVPVINKAALEADIDVVFPILNMIGMGILKGSREEMEAAVQQCISFGKGVYLMKALAGGNLIDKYDEAMSYCRSIPGVASVAVGMVSKAEVDFNLAYYKGSVDKRELPTMEKNEKRVVIVQSLCRGCGSCIDICPNEAIVMKGEKSQIIEAECLTCGYCVSGCPEFAIRVI